MPSDTQIRDRTMVFGGNVEVERRFMRARLNVMIGASKIAGRLLARRK
jgi:hypothetical protein